MADVSELTALMDAAISELQTGFLDDSQIEASRTIMGLDTELIEDGTYFVVAIDGEVAGCGGWSRRATLYGGNETSGRDSGLLDPAVDAARVRAMYTHPRSHGEAWAAESCRSARRQQPRKGSGVSS
jgi:hypothetical protein